MSLKTCLTCGKLFYDDENAYVTHKSMCGKSKMQFQAPQLVTEDQARIISEGGKATEANLGMFATDSLTQTRKRAKEAGVKNTGRKTKEELVTEIKNIEAKDGKS